MSSRCAGIVVAVLVALPLGACLQKLDATAASQASVSATDALVTEIDPGAAAGDACDKTRQDKTEILTAYCARCHSGPTAVGLPPWDFVLDDQRLVTETWLRAGQPPARFVIPGDPDHSALYQRMVLVQDMPPQPTDVSTPPNPKPSAADGTVIREWILNCLGASAPSATGGAAGTATGGTGGTAPTDGGAGASGGAAGGRGGSTGAAGAGGATSACSAGVTAGESCTTRGATCALGNMVCTCAFSNMRRQWICN